MTPEQRAAYQASLKATAHQGSRATADGDAPTARAQGPKFVGGGTSPAGCQERGWLEQLPGRCSGCYPPDQAIATDLSYVMEGDNTSVAIFIANTGALQFGPYSADSFFSPVNQAGDLFSDPQMNYDVMRDRWIVRGSSDPADDSTTLTSR